MKQLDEQHENYHRVALAIDFLALHRESQPSLAELAEHIGLSEFHLQRVFTQWAGISPKQFLQYLTKEYAKRQLRQHSVLDSALTAGLSGPGRLHDLMLRFEGVTPGEYRNFGHGLRIEYGVAETPFGYAFIARTARGICHLSFFEKIEEQAIWLNQLKAVWSMAELFYAPDMVSELAGQIFSAGQEKNKPLKLLVKGSAFQLKVWEALLAVPTGGLCSYQDIASSIGQPKTVRAVASAIAQNSIGYLIPCHRVIRSTGEFNQYRWGAQRKQAMIAWEAARN